MSNIDIDLADIENRTQAELEPLLAGVTRALALRGDPAPFQPGPPGASAYEIDVANGFQGTEEDWLATIRGKDADLSTVVAALTPATENDALVSALAAQIKKQLDPTGAYASLADLMAAALASGQPTDEGVALPIVSDPASSVIFAAKRNKFNNGFTIEVSEPEELAGTHDVTDEVIAAAAGRPLWVSSPKATEEPAGTWTLGSSLVLSPADDPVVISGLFRRGGSKIIAEASSYTLDAEDADELVEAAGTAHNDRTAGGPVVSEWQVIQPARVYAAQPVPIARNTESYLTLDGQDFAEGGKFAAVWHGRSDERDLNSENLLWAIQDDNNVTHAQLVETKFGTSERRAQVIVEVDPTRGVNSSSDRDGENDYRSGEHFCLVVHFDIAVGVKLYTSRVGRPFVVKHLPVHNDTAAGEALKQMSRLRVFSGATLRSGRAAKPWNGLFGGLQIWNPAALPDPQTDAYLKAAINTLTWGPKDDKLNALYGGAPKVALFGSPADVDAGLNHGTAGDLTRIGPSLGDAA